MMLNNSTSCCHFLCPLTWRFGGGSGFIFAMGRDYMGLESRGVLNFACLNIARTGKVMSMFTTFELSVCSQNRCWSSSWQFNLCCGLSFVFLMKSNDVIQFFNSFIILTKYIVFCWKTSPHRTRVVVIHTGILQDKENIGPICIICNQKTRQNKDGLAPSINTQEECTLGQLLFRNNEIVQCIISSSTRW